MNPQSAYYQKQAVAILTIATAIIGFGLFGSDLHKDVIRLGPGSQVPPLVAIKYLFAGAAIVHYLLLVESVRRVFKQTIPVSGQQIGDGPLFFMLLEIFYVALMFIFGAFEITDNTVRGLLV